MHSSLPGITAGLLFHMQYTEGMHLQKSTVPTQGIAMFLEKDYRDTDPVDLPCRKEQYGFNRQIKAIYHSIGGEGH